MLIDPRIPSTWALTTINGKVPTRKGWQSEPPLSREAIAEWRGNLGLRTGTVSGLVVIDIDPKAGGTRLDWLPETVTVETGGGGLHLYYSIDRPLPNSASRLAPGVDIRGDGGQVVFPGSIHPDTGAPYQWLLPPWEHPVVPLPDRVRQHVTAPKLSAYARAALDAETAAVRGASNGHRNDQLNRSAFSLSQLVAGGQLPERIARDTLRAAGVAAGLDSGEVDRTVDSGFRAGAMHPRRPADVPHDPCQTVLIPGEHIEASGECVDRGTHEFAEDVLRALPDGALYRRDMRVVELTGPRGTMRFQAVVPDRMRLVVDGNVTLAKWIKGKKRFQPCSRDLAGVVLAAAPTSTRVRQPNTLTRYPVFAGPGFTLSASGWNESTGVYYDEPEELQGIGPTPFDVNTIVDIIEDFPFRDDASRANLIGLMLTPLIRPAVDVVPLHLVQSSIERTGKGMLINAALGNAVLGGAVPSVQIGEREEEREKRFTTLIIEGATIVHLDNLPSGSVLDSPSLCALTTSPTWKGRTLGVSEMPTLPNTLTLVASANNLRSTGEVAKRIVPIWLQPKDDHPETRSDFQHPDICAYAGTRRRDVLGCLIGMVSRWITAGRPPGTRRMGGFEQWAAAVGGIMEMHDLGGDWLANRSEWADQADEWTQDAKQLGEAWFTKHGPTEISASQVLDILVDEKIFLDVLAKPDNARLRTLAARVIKPMTDRPISFLGRLWAVKLYRSEHAKANRYCLTELAQ